MNSQKGKKYPRPRCATSLGGLATAALVALAAGTALGQTPSAAQLAPTDVKPIGDWTVRCFPVESISPCDMYEELDDKNTHQRVLSVSISYSPSTDQNMVQIAVPVGIAIPQGVTIQTGSFISSPLPYRRCEQEGCFVEMALSEDTINALDRTGAKATIRIMAYQGKWVDLPFPVNGFSAAHDAMAGLARQRGPARPK